MAGKWKKTVVSFLFIFILVPLFSQELRGGLFIYPNMSWIDGSDFEEDFLHYLGVNNVDHKGKFSFSAGGFFEIPLRQSISFQHDVLPARLQRRRDLRCTGSRPPADRRSAQRLDLPARHHDECFPLHRPFGQHGHLFL